jgi:hypothetical protein
MPGDTSTLEHVFHFPLIASVQVERVSDRVREDRAACRIATSFAMGIQPLRKLWNNWHWGSRFRGFGITDCAPPHRACDVQPAE